MTCRNLILTMLLGGLWHGANWTFVVWGAYHGTLLVLGRVVRVPRRSSAVLEPAWTLLTFLAFCLGW